MGVKYGFIKTAPPALIARILHFFLERLAKIKPKLFSAANHYQESQLMTNLVVGPAKFTTNDLGLEKLWLSFIIYQEGKLTRSIKVWVLFAQKFKLSEVLELVSTVE